MASKFRKFYDDEKLPQNLITFLSMPFSIQVGVYIKFFDVIYGLGVVFDRHGYAVYSSDSKITGWKDYTKPLASEYFKESENILVNAERALLKIIEFVKVPF